MCREMPELFPRELVPQSAAPPSVAIGAQRAARVVRGPCWEGGGFQWTPTKLE